MKEKITKLKDWYNSLNSTKQKLVKYGIIASILCIIAVCFVAYPIYDVALPVILELVTN